MSLSFQAGLKTLIIFEKLVMGNVLCHSSSSWLTKQELCAAYSVHWIKLGSRTITGSIHVFYLETHSVSGKKTRANMFRTERLTYSLAVHRLEHTNREMHTFLTRRLLFPVVSTRRSSLRRHSPETLFWEWMNECPGMYLKSRTKKIGSSCAAPLPLTGNWVPVALSLFPTSGLTVSSHCEFYVRSHCRLWCATC